VLIFEKKFRRQRVKGLKIKTLLMFWYKVRSEEYKEKTVFQQIFVPGRSDFVSRLCLTHLGGSYSIGTYVLGSTLEQVTIASWQVLNSSLKIAI
jgi:hypothetical protein